MSEWLPILCVPRTLAAVVLVSLLSFAPAVTGETLPEITAPVTDLADVVSEPVESDLSQTLRAHYDATGVQMAVLVVESTGGEPIEDYSFRVASAWGGGNAGEDRGILLTLAIDDRRSRLEVGYGLEGLLPDQRAAIILRKMREPMRAGDVDRAIELATTSVIDKTDHLEPGKRVGLWDLHPLWNGSLGMFLMALLGLLVVGVPAYMTSQSSSSERRTRLIALAIVAFCVFGGLVYWLALDIAPWGYLAVYASGAVGGVVLGAADSWRRFVPIPGLFGFFCLVAIFPGFRNGLPAEPDVKLFFMGLSYAMCTSLPYVSTFDTTTYGSSRRDRDDDGGFSSGSSSSGGDYSGGGGSFGGGGASGGW